MKPIVCILLLFLGLVVSGYSQLRIVDYQDDFVEETTIIRLTPEMFLNDMELPGIGFKSEQSIPLLEKKPTILFLQFGSGLLRNKLDLDFVGSTNFPLNVTQYNNAIRRQMFDAEPTSQQRRNTLFPFN